MWDYIGSIRSLSNKSGFVRFGWHMFHFISSTLILENCYHFTWQTPHPAGKPTAGSNETSWMNQLVQWLQAKCAELLALELSWLWMHMFNCFSKPALSNTWVFLSLPFSHVSVLSTYYQGDISIPSLVCLFGMRGFCLLFLVYKIYWNSFLSDTGPQSSLTFSWSRKSLFT